jgi:lysophospholipase L1-like esterase/D-alanyl-lipoteichoic acid acyltransferase DltB (MBOAT superfamily)
MDGSSATAGSRSAPAAPIARLDRAGLARLAALALQFGLLLLVVQQFQLETRAFVRLLALGWIGFVVQALLPARLHLAWFALLSLAGIVLVLGVANAAALVGIGIALVGIAHLPVAFGQRLLLLGLAGACLALLRSGWLAAPFSAALWPLLGSMFMFRLILYLYDLRHRAAALGVWQALAYFFMLPNVCFPLFPVVDYKAFVRSHQSGELHRIHQKGLGWMLRGIVHLLLYRLVYQNFLIDAGSVASAGEAAWSMLATFLLYLRISGDFHLVVGLLHLYGFDLPEAFHHWLLPASFTDFWRRINVYWKEFMQKVCFNPAHFALRRRIGDGPALLAATAITFVVTWALHSYQWFWIRGAFPLRLQDALFWGSLGALVLANAHSERTRGRIRTLGGRRRTLRAEAALGLRTLATVAAVVAIWSLWTAASIDEWRLLVAQLLRPTPREALAIGAGLAAFGVAAVASDRRTLARLAAARRARDGREAAFWRPALAVSGASALLLAVGAHPWAFDAEPRLADALHRLRSREELSRRDAELMERGYYEDLTDVVSFNTQLAELYAERPSDWNLTPHILETPGSYPPYRLRPGIRVTYHRAGLSVNRWGMRDRDYERAKPAGTWRAAILGDSHTFGAGVEDAETYENLVEDRLNREDPDGRRYEILNFSVGGYGPLSRLAVLEREVLPFDPDAVIYVGVDDFTWVVTEMIHAARTGLALPLARVAELLRRNEVDAGLPRVVAERRLAPHAREVVGRVYAEFAARARARGVRPLAAFLPRPEAIRGERERIAEQMELAERAGFRVLDLSPAFGNAGDLEALWVARWDRHPNARGHRMLADALYPALRAELGETAR